mgnify:CR=1 FL=1
MSHVDGYVLAVPAEKREAYRQVAVAAAKHFRNHGATRVVETWEDDVPEGKLTSFPLAVKREAGEAIVFSWVEWPDKATRDGALDAAYADMQKDPALAEMPFDGKRMIFGSFEVLLDA